MANVRSFKMTHTSKKFNANQRVFIIYMTGAQAAYCYGRFRGRFRYIKAWVRWDTPSRPFPNIQEFEVEDGCGIAKVCV
jgi:hypothetical protein